MRTLFALFFLLVACIANAQHTPIEFEENGLFGLRYPEGTIAVEPKFVMVMGFNEYGICAVIDEKGWAYINLTGHVILRPFVFDNGPDYFSEGLARFVHKNRIGFFNQSGKIVVAPFYDFARPFSNGLAAVCNGCEKEIIDEHYIMKGGKWGFIDKNGEIVIPLKYNDVNDFENGTAKVKTDKWIEIDKQGKIVR